MYSQGGEDDILFKYLDKDKTNGKYIDIGAGEPINISNTYVLYQKGWKGLAVEPWEPYREQWRQHRPNDIFITSPIMDSEREIKMIHTVAEGSWIYDTYVKELNNEFIIRHAITLKKLLDTYPDFYECDLLSLDVELAEDKVLVTADFTKFKPKLIIIEKQVRGINSKPRWEHLLLPYYNAVEEFPGNTFYLRKD